ncbi:MAG TPA: zf-HC2 domain-containing protein [Gemmataceae bacterium]|nr:zf-HC2 domain-containing protein [Gemmataceae bacterium]
MKNCHEIRAALPALLYGDLPPDEATAVRQHLTDCPACRAEQAALQQVRGLLDATATPKVAVDVPGVYREAALRQEKRLRRWRRVACGALAAAAVLLLVFGLKLEVRWEQHQLVLRWGAPPAAVPVPPPAPLELPPEAASAAEVRRMRDLLHLLAAELEEREQRQQQALAWLRVRLETLQAQTREHWAATERDVRGLYTLFTREKGE